MSVQKVGTIVSTEIDHNGEYAIHIATVECPQCNVRMELTYDDGTQPHWTQDNGIKRQCACGLYWSLEMRAIATLPGDRIEQEIVNLKSVATQFGMSEQSVLELIDSGDATVADITTRADLPQRKGLITMLYGKCLADQRRV